MRHGKDNAMPKRIKAGDKVEWNTSQGPTSGTVKKKLTRPTDIKGHHVAASADDPQYLVQSEKSGGLAAHKPGALRKKAR
jgi:hypothetical protein